MNDPFRLENITRADRARALDMAKRMSMDGVTLDPRFLERQLSSDAEFNALDPKIRQELFKSLGSQPIRVSQNAPTSGGGLLDALRQTRREYETRETTKPQADSALPTDLRSALSDTRKEYETKQAQELEAQRQQEIATAAVNQASIPQLDAAGRVVRDQPKARETRKVKDFMTTVKEGLIGGGEALLTVGSGGVMAPIAAVEQLGSDILTKAGGKKPTGTDVFAKRMEAATYKPRSETGKEIVGTLGEAFEASKLPPVLTPEFMALSAAGRVPPKPPKTKPQMGTLEAAQTQAIIEGTAPQFRQDPAGLPGLASVGAAGRRDPVAIEAAIAALPFEAQSQARAVPMNKINLNALESHGQALNLPAPVSLTRGQATQDLVVLSNELNRRGELPNIANRMGEQNAALVDNLRLIREQAAPDVFGTKSSDFGQIVIDNYKAIDDARRISIGDLYRQLEQAAGGDFPIDAAKFARTADQQLSKKLKSEFLPPTIDRQLQAYRSGGKMDFEQFEALRTNLATEMRRAARAGDGNAEMALSVVRDALESLPLSGEAAALKPLADAARSAAKERFDALRRDPAYKAAVDDAVAPENFVSTFVLSKGKGTEKNVRTMIEALGRGSDGQQAVAADIMAHLTKQAIDGKGNFSQAAFNKALREIDPKLLEIFDAATAKTLKDLGEVSRKVMAQPTGSFANNSGTFVAALAQKAGQGAEQTLNLAVPGLSLGTMAAQARAARAGKKFERESLKPLAGIEGESNLIRDLLNKREK
jgi:hypothetical protein